MRLDQTLALAGLGLLAAACANTRGYEAKLDAWVGVDEAALVDHWGPPAGMFVTPDGTRVLTFQTVERRYVAGQQPRYQTMVIGKATYTTTVGGYPGMNIALTCATAFTLVDGKVTGWRHKGNNCAAQ